MQPGALASEERAIEGLPIRLVIALVVGIASLSVMMNTLGGIQTLGVTELDAQPTPEVLKTGSDATDLDVTVVDPNGARIANATVVLTSGTARIDGVQTDETNYNGTASFSIEPTLDPNQQEGTLEVSIKPPAGEQYADKRENTLVLVLADN